MVKVTRDGVLFAKSSDRDPNEAQLLEWQPRRSWAPGLRMHATWIDIAQAVETHAVLLSRPFWMWGAEIAANEHGVIVGNEAVFTTEPYRELGLTGMDLVRLAAERGATAEEAVTVIVDLLDRYGQGGGCGLEKRDFTYHNSFLVADASEAFVVETAGRHWATERVTSGARSISNALTIPELANHYTDRLHTHFARGHERREITERAAGRAGDPGDLMTVLRDHGNHTLAPQYSVLTGALAAPCVHPSGEAAASQTTASWVADLRPGHSSHWVTGTAAPCTSLFKPIRVDQPLDLGPPPTDRFDPRCLWWRHELLHRAALTDPARLLPLFISERDQIEARWLERAPEPAVAFTDAEQLLEAWTTKVWNALDRDVRPMWVRHYWHRRNQWAGLPEPRRGVQHDAGMTRATR